MFTISTYSLRRNGGLDKPAAVIQSGMWNFGEFLRHGSLMMFLSCICFVVLNGRMTGE
jgi:hypothetical protein